MALQELVIVNPSPRKAKRRRTTKRKVNNMARRKVSRRKTPARRKTTARRKTARRKTTTRRKSPARRKTTKRKTTTRRRKSPARRKTTRRKTTTRRKAPARRKTTRRRKSPARRKTTRRKTTTRRRKAPARRKTTRRRKSPARRRTSRRRSVSRRKTASRRRTTRSRKFSGSAAMKWTRQNLMKFEVMAALASGLAISSALPILVEGALSKVGINKSLTTGYTGTAVTIAGAGLAGYALYTIGGVSAQTAGLFTVAAMLPAALLALNSAGLSFIPTLTVQNNPFKAAATNGLYGILGNPGTVIEEPIFGGYHDGMHAGVHMPVMGAGEMFGLGGKEINLF